MPESLSLPVPRRGLVDGIDPASDAFPADAAPDLENFRVQGLLWQTRLGMSLFQTLGGSGALQWLGNYFKSDGTVRRLAARGGTLYESSGGAFSAATGGSGLHATNRFSGAMLRDYLYFTDRSAVLKRYNTAGVTTPGQGTAPASAPTVKPQPFAKLEDWSSLTPWVQSASSHFSRTDVTASFTDDPPIGTKVIRLQWDTSAKSATIKNTSAFSIASHAIAFYVQSTVNKPRLNIELGVTNPGDFPTPLTPVRKNEWEAFFVNVGNVTAFGTIQFRCIKPDTGGSDYVTELWLPGKLNGKYRYCYTYYDSTTGAETTPSAASAFADCLASGVNGSSDPAVAAAFNKSVLVTMAGAGSADKIRIYRNGGATALTTDSSGQAVWTLVGTVSNPGSGTTTFVDNLGDEDIATNLRLDLNRNDPPAGSLWVSVSPDERLWLFGPGQLVSVSNRRTPDRPMDHEVFPSGVDPLTRGSLLQGWQFYVGGNAGGDEIIWGGFYRGVPTVLTRKALYQIHAYSQAEWGPTAVQKVLDTGCLAGNTVAEVNGVLTWVTDGPKVVRWAGGGEPQDISFQRVSTTLQNAPSAYWSNWLAVAHSDLNGAHYRLWITPTGQTTNTKRLEWNAAADAWETSVHYDGSGNQLPWGAALVWDGPTDTKQLYAGHPTNGKIYQVETGLTDDSVAIKVRGATRKFPLGAVSQGERLYFRLAGVSDTLSVTVTCGGSEYRKRDGSNNDIGDPSFTASVALSGTGDEEFDKRLDYTTLKGRWVQVQVSGDVSHRPALREVQVLYTPVREGRVTQ